MASAQQIASLYAKISADVGDFEKALKSVKSNMSGLEKTSNALGATFKAAFAVGTTAIGGFSAAVGVSVKAAADMEQKVADIRAIFGKTAPDVEKLNDLILKLGLDPKLKVSATQAADAIEMLGKNGLSMSEIMSGAARNTILLANATGDNFALAADIATDVMKQFNVSASNMSQAVDGIVGVTQASKFDINDYALAIAQAGGVASSVGVSLDDFNAAIAATSSSFSSGSDAGTSFKVFLQRLVPQTDNAKAALKELGLMTDDGGSKFFDASGKMKSMEEIAGLLQGAFMGLSDAQKISTASTLFGTDAMRTALALAKGGSATILEMKQIIGDTSAEEAAALRMNTFKGAIEIAQGIIESITISIGQKFLPVLRPLVEKFNELATQYGPMVVDWFGQVAIVIGNAIHDFLGLGTAAEESTDIVRSGAETSKTIVTALGSAVGDANKTFAQLKGVLTGNKEVVDSLGSGFGTLIQNFWNTIEAVKLVLKPVTDVIAKFVSWKDVITALELIVSKMLLGALGALVAAMWPVIQTVALVTAAVAAMRWAWENDFLGVQTFTKNTLDKLTNWFLNDSGLWKGTWQDTLDYFEWWASGGWKNYIYFPIRTRLYEVYWEFESWRKRTILTVENWAKDVIASVTDWKNEIALRFTIAKDKILSAIEDWVGPTMHDLDVWVRTSESKFHIWYGWVEKYVGDARDWIVEKWQGVLDWWSAHVQPFVDRGREMMQGLWNGAKEVWNRFSDWWRGLWQTLTGTVDVKLRIGSPSKEMMERGRWTIEGFAKGVQQAMPMAMNAMSGLATNTLNADEYTGYTVDYGASASGEISEEAALMRENNNLLRILIAELRNKNMNVTVNSGGTGMDYGALVTTNAGLAR